MARISVGLRELRQHASSLVRRVEEGEEVVVTVNGRPAARLSAPEPGYWRRAADVGELFAGHPTDTDTWLEDMRRLDGSVADPFKARE
ncbi:MAG: type II toxin-antitoxin system prevent-host-death family antitoxin [Candidatus Dormibacteria bacterium]